MDIERSFSFAFKAKGALKKLALGGVFMLLFWTVFFAFVVAGYLIRVLINTMEGRDATLPEWDDLLPLFQEGLQPVLISLAYYAPFFAVMIVDIIIQSIVGGSLLFMALFGLLRLVFALLASVILPLAMIRFVVKRSISAAFDFGQIFDFIKKNPGTYLTAWGLSLVVGLGSVLGLLALVVGFCFTSFIALVITTHLYAGAYRASTPFSDDAEGEIRASIAMPPPLRTSGNGQKTG